MLFYNILKTLNEYLYFYKSHKKLLYFSREIKLISILKIINFFNLKIGNKFSTEAKIKLHLWVIHFLDF